MEIIIEGDQSQMVENFTRVMFDITMERIKNSIKNGTLEELINEVENSKNKEAALKERRLPE